MALMRIGKRLVGDGHETLMFAEEGQANDGDMSIALDMCRKAAAVGADGIEFQLSRAPASPWLPRWIHIQVLTR
jgi:sialic acid synthase SpsE